MAVQYGTGLYGVGLYDPSAPTLSLLAVTTPSPGVQITVTLPDPSAVTVTIWRTSASGERVVVRGADRRVIVGATSVVDFEAPIGELLTYTAATFDGSGQQSGETPGSTITLPVPTAQSGYVSDPFTPSSIAVLVFHVAPDRAMNIDSAVLWPIGSNRAVVVSGARRLGEFTFALVACSETDRDALRDLLLTAPVVLLRTAHPEWDVPQDFYAVGDVTERRVAVRPIKEPRRLFEFPATIARRPEPSLEAPLHTYAEMTSTGKTYGQLTTEGKTYLQLLQSGA